MTEQLRYFAQAFRDAAEGDDLLRWGRLCAEWEESGLAESPDPLVAAIKKLRGRFWHEGTIKGRAQYHAAIRRIEELLL